MNNSNTNIDKLKTFEVIFNKYYSGLIVYANKYTFEKSFSEDIVHDVFIKLWENLNFSEVNSVKSYLFTSVKHQCLNHIEKLKIRNIYQEQILKKGEVNGNLTWEYYVEDELRIAIENAVNKLPRQRRIVFIMNRFDGKTANEIAQELNISPATVRKHIELSLKELHKELSVYLPNYIIFMLIYPWNI